MTVENTTELLPIQTRQPPASWLAGREHDLRTAETAALCDPVRREPQPPAVSWPRIYPGL